MTRLRANFLDGVLSSSATDTDTTVSSEQFAAIPEIIADSGEMMAIVIDPAGAQEIVWVTVHDSGSFNATVVRGQEGTTASAHDDATEWSNNLTADDIDTMDAVYVWDGSEYVLTGRKTFVGPEDPSTEGFTLAVGDTWEEADV